jgi:hypothetical protein
MSKAPGIYTLPWCTRICPFSPLPPMPAALHRSLIRKRSCGRRLQRHAAQHLRSSRELVAEALDITSAWGLGYLESDLERERPTPCCSQSIHHLQPLVLYLQKPLHWVLWPDDSDSMCTSSVVRKLHQPSAGCDLASRWQSRNSVSTQRTS